MNKSILCPNCGEYATVDPDWKCDREQQVKAICKHCDSQIIAPICLHCSGTEYIGNLRCFCRGGIDLMGTVSATRKTAVAIEKLTFGVPVTSPRKRSRK